MTKASPSSPAIRAVRATCALALALLAVPTSGHAAPNDPLFAKQWGLVAVRAEQAWAYSRGAGVTIAVVDSGVDHTHEDLQGRVLRPAGSNFDCPANSPPACPNDPVDDNGHGTHVAGIAAARAGNRKGIAGVAPDAKILAVKVLDENGDGLGEDLADGIRFAADHGAEVINVSAGSLVPGVELVPGLTDDIDGEISYAWNKGAVIVVAAGNLNLPICQYPSGHTDVICVGAVDRHGDFTFFSNFGPRTDVVAPGGSAPLILEAEEDYTAVGVAPLAAQVQDGFISVGGCDLDTDIWSTWSTHPLAAQSECEAPDGYETLAGTSMAAPFVSGVAALLAAEGLDNSQIVACIRNTAQDLGQPGRDDLYGHGRVDALKAVRDC